LLLIIVFVTVWTISLHSVVVQRTSHHATPQIRMFAPETKNQRPPTLSDNDDDCFIPRHQS